MLRVSTRDAIGTNRLDYWNALLSGVFPGMQVQAARDIDASWTAVRLGDIYVAHAASPRARIERWARHGPAQASDRALLHVQHRGMSTTIQRGVEASARAGEVALCLADEPYRIDLSPDNHCVVVDFPRSLLAGVAHGPGRLGQDDRPGAAVLHDLLLSVLRQDWSGQPADETAMLGRVVGGMVRQCVANAPVAPAPAPDMAARVVRFAEDNLQDSGLRTGIIARRLSLSDDMVQRLFAERGTTVTQWIIDRRLALAAQRLDDPHRTGTLAALAADLGFSDAAHFCRRFRQRFGMSPGRYARAARGA